jgi:hypothetical protein
MTQSRALMRKSLPTLLLATFSIMTMVLAVHLRATNSPSETTASETIDSAVGQVLLGQFEQRIWPLLTRGEGASCVNCHDAENKSELHFFPDAPSNFKMLMENGYFSTTDPDALLGRLTSTHPKKHMPKGKGAEEWAEKEIELLRSFATNLTARLKSTGRADERFPSALLTPFQGKIPSSLDNQFISYRQLKGKVRTIFKDDWHRNGRDLFQENVSLFGGADFKERFNETTKATATFLTGLEMLSRDVAARSYNQKTGPFANRSDHLPSPLSLRGPDEMYEREISRLYQSILFRPPASHEMHEAFDLLQNIYRSEDEIRETDFELSFSLTVEDPDTGLRASRMVSIPISGETRGLHQELIDQSAGAVEEENSAEDDKPANRRNRRVSGQIAKQKLAGTFTFKPNDARQSFRLSNLNTVGNVSFQSIELRLAGNSDTNDILRIAATNSTVQAEGAWKFEDRRGFASFEDENNDKGNSNIRVPISVAREGRYEIVVSWRKNTDNARGILVEVVSHDADSLSRPPLQEAPPRGEAHYSIDQSEDSIAFADLNALFQFGETDYVEVNNKGTRNRVTADAVKFISIRDKTALLVDNDEASGKENWKVYDSGQFRAYNQTGKNTYHDENARKGELWLRYLPSIKKEAWKPDQFYQVHVGYPAKRDHEIRTPIIVKAQKSSPIIQVGYPSRARGDSCIEIDASASYTVQRSALRFVWRQTGGPTITLDDWNTPKLAFQVPRLTAPAAAWQGLARALMRHPDFIFTRPPAIQKIQDEKTKRRLQLVKIAQDLVGRPPSQDELEKLASGKSLPQILDGYLDSPEFREFYFHRIRLYVESQGTETQDEPARLWCYIAFHDRPFQEILTADYTVDAKMQKQPRPAYHGQTGVLTTRGFIEGKPGLPHFNYAAQVTELFLGYVFEVPPEVVQQREGITAVSTTDPASLCYSCHKVLTPLAFQRNRWDDRGLYRIHDDYGLPIDDSDQKLVPAYPFAGDGMEAFALQAVRKERFIRTIINTHFTFFFGREMRYREDERVLYKTLWDSVHANHFSIRSLIKAILLSPEYLEGRSIVNAELQTAQTKK